jgi:uncharacterized ferritin-like protein (DUF455 family)
MHALGRDVLSQHLESIFFGKSLEEKCRYLAFEDIPWEHFLPHPSIKEKNPGRAHQLEMQKGHPPLKFPHSSQLIHKDKKALTLHAFANHELLAIEMMCYALLFYPHHTLDLLHFKKQLYLSLCDEQKHLHLYVKRIQQLGYDFGDFPLNGFFWNYIPQLTSSAHFAATMNLTFEQANLDFAHEYHQHFQKIGDTTSASIMETVLKDEIVHVKRGFRSLQDWKQEEDSWDFYINHLPQKLSPARAKGRYFQKHLREQAGFDLSFTEQVEHFQGNFPVTKRKTWTSPPTLTI